jgi:hypothetical protein
MVTMVSWLLLFPTHNLIFFLAVKQKSSAWGKSLAEEDLMLLEQEELLQLLGPRARVLFFHNIICTFTLNC